jgi:hypothetical protein
MSDNEIEKISATLAKLATPKTTPRELLKAVRKRHPDASKKTIVRAAFYSIISNADADPAKAERLQGFAIGERASGDLD